MYLMKDRRGAGPATSARPTNLRRAGAVVLRRRHSAQGPPTPPGDRGDRLDRMQPRTRGSGACDRLIHELEPRFNRQGKRWRAPRVLRQAHTRRTVPPARRRHARSRPTVRCTSVRSRPRAPRTPFGRPSSPPLPLRRCTARIADAPQTVRPRTRRARPPNSVWPRLSVSRPRPARPMTTRSSRPCAAGLTGEPRLLARSAGARDARAWPTRSGSKRRPHPRSARRRSSRMLRRRQTLEWLVDQRADGDRRRRRNRRAHGRPPVLGDPELDFTATENPAPMHARSAGRTARRLLDPAPTSTSSWSSPAGSIVRSTAGPSAAARGVRCADITAVPAPCRPTSRCLGAGSGVGADPARPGSELVGCGRRIRRRLRGAGAETHPDGCAAVPTADGVARRLPTSEPAALAAGRSRRRAVPISRARAACDAGVGSTIRVPSMNSRRTAR